MPTAPCRGGPNPPGVTTASTRTAVHTPFGRPRGRGSCRRAPIGVHQTRDQCHHHHVVAHTPAAPLIGRDAEVAALLATAAAARAGEPRCVIETVHVDDAGEWSFTYDRDSSPARELWGERDERDAAQVLAAYDLIYISLITLQIMEVTARHRLRTALASARRCKASVAFDSNYRPTGWASTNDARRVVEATLDHLDIALPTLGDESQICGKQSSEDWRQQVPRPRDRGGRGQDRRGGLPPVLRTGDSAHPRCSGSQHRGHPCRRRLLQRRLPSRSTHRSGALRCCHQGHSDGGRGHPASRSDLAPPPSGGQPPPTGR